MSYNQKIFENQHFDNISDMESTNIAIICEQSKRQENVKMRSDEDTLLAGNSSPFKFAFLQEDFSGFIGPNSINGDLDQEQILRESFAKDDSEFNLEDVLLDFNAPDISGHYKEAEQG